jgi:hypothetical protein
MDLKWKPGQQHSYLPLDTYPDTGSYAVTVTVTINQRCPVVHQYRICHTTSKKLHSPIYPTGSCALRYTACIRIFC